MRLLIVEDEARITELVREAALVSQSMQVGLCTKVRTALTLASYDAAIRGPPFTAGIDLIAVSSQSGKLRFYGVCAR